MIRDRTIHPSKEGYHPRSLSATFKRLIKVKYRLESALKSTDQLPAPCYSNTRLSINLRTDRRHFEYGPEQENKARSHISTRVPICTCQHARTRPPRHHLTPGNIVNENDFSNYHRFEKIAQKMNVDSLVQSQRELHVTLPSADADWMAG